MLLATDICDACCLYKHIHMPSWIHAASYRHVTLAACTNTYTCPVGYMLLPTDMWRLLPVQTHTHVQLDTCCFLQTYVMLAACTNTYTCPVGYMLLAIDICVACCLYKHIHMPSWTHAACYRHMWCLLPVQTHTHAQLDTCCFLQTCDACCLYKHIHMSSWIHAASYRHMWCLLPVQTHTHAQLDTCCLLQTYVTLAACTNTYTCPVGYMLLAIDICVACCLYKHIHMPSWIHAACYRHMWRLLPVQTHTHVQLDTCCFLQTYVMLAACTNTYTCPVGYMLLATDIRDACCLYKHIHMSSWIHAACYRHTWRLLPVQTHTHVQLDTCCLLQTYVTLAACTNTYTCPVGYMLLATDICDACCLYKHIHMPSWIHAACYRHMWRLLPVQTHTHVQLDICCLLQTYVTLAACTNTYTCPVGYMLLATDIRDACCLYKHIHMSSWIYAACYRHTWRLLPVQTHTHSVEGGGTEIP